MAAEVLLDASALLALLNDEPGAESVEGTLPHAAICTVNLAEVLGTLARHGIPSSEARRSVRSLGLRVIAFTETMAGLAGDLEPRTRTLGLSLGDRACLACAHNADLPVMTADRAWRRARLGIEIRLIRA